MGDAASCAKANQKVPSGYYKAPSSSSPTGRCGQTRCWCFEARPGRSLFSGEVWCGFEDLPDADRAESGGPGGVVPATRRAPQLGLEFISS